MLVAWIPFLGRFFPGRAECSNARDDSELPAARVAVIGAGIGGCFAANFLREFNGGKNLEIHVWNKKESRVGGRTATTEFAGHTYETGGSIMHSSNKYLVDAVKKYGEQNNCYACTACLYVYPCTYKCILASMRCDVHVYTCVHFYFFFLGGAAIYMYMYM